MKGILYIYKMKGTIREIFPLEGAGFKVWTALGEEVRSHDEKLVLSDEGEPCFLSTSGRCYILRTCTCTNGLYSLYSSIAPCAALFVGAASDSQSLSNNIFNLPVCVTGCSDIFLIFFFFFFPHFLTFLWSVNKKLNIVYP